MVFLSEKKTFSSYTISYIVIPVAIQTQLNNNCYGNISNLEISHLARFFALILGQISITMEAILALTDIH